MSNPIQALFLPFYKVMHWPDMAEYQRSQRDWALSLILDESYLKPGMVVLELGCGEGWVAKWMADRGVKVVGFDINPPRMRPAERDDVLLVAAEVERIPVASESVDLIVSVGVLEHLPDRPTAMAELSRTLKPGAKMVHYVPGSASKVLQLGGYVPWLVRKEVRGVSRALAGRRTQRGDEAKRQRGGKEYHVGKETNNPRRASRRRKFWHKFTPRVHGEYNSHWQEFMDSRKSFWVKDFEATGWTVTRSEPLGLHSLYGWGWKAMARGSRKLGVASAWGFVLEKKG